MPREDETDVQYHEGMNEYSVPRGDERMLSATGGWVNAQCHRGLTRRSVPRGDERAFSATGE